MILKKQISIILTFFLLVSNLGLAFNVHYCADSIESISIQLIPSSTNEVDECCGIIEKDSQCCDDKVIKAESKVDQIRVQLLSIDANFIVVENDIQELFRIPSIQISRDYQTYYCDANAPPFYLLYCQYIFYA